MAQKGRVVNHGDFLVINSYAYEISQLDYCAFSAEEIINSFLSVLTEQKLQGKKSSSCMTV